MKRDYYTIDMFWAGVSLLTVYLTNHESAAIQNVNKEMYKTALCCHSAVQSPSPPTHLCQWLLPLLIIKIMIL
jgi:hypothetical protein